MQQDRLAVTSASNCRRRFHRIGKRVGIAQRRRRASTAPQSATPPLPAFGIEPGTAAHHGLEGDQRYIVPRQQDQPHAVGERCAQVRGMRTPALIEA